MGGGKEWGRVGLAFGKVDGIKRSSLYSGFNSDTLTPLHIKYTVADVWFIWLVTGLYTFQHSGCIYIYIYKVLE